MLSMTACTEVLEPNVDYGSNTYTNDYSSLVKAVNDLQKSLEDRFDALNTLLKAGMADIEIAIDENTGAIEVLEATTNSGLAKIDTTLVNGFDAISTSVDSAGNKVVTALDENGNLLRLTIDNNGKLLNTALENLATMLENIDKSLTSYNASFNTKISALNSLLSTGFTAIGKKIGDNGTDIVTALSANGDIIKIAINEQGKAISTEIESLNDKLTNEDTGLLPALITVQGELKTAVDGLTAQEKTNAEDIIKKLDEMINNNGIYVVADKATGKQNIYVTPEAWASMKDNEDVKAAYGSLINELEVEIDKHLWWDDGSDMAKYDYYMQVEYEGEATVQARDLKAYPDVTGSEEKLLYKLYKFPTEITLNVIAYTQEFGDYVKAYKIKDAKGEHGKKVSDSPESTATEFERWNFSIKAYILDDNKISLTEDGTKAFVRIDLYSHVQVEAGATDGMTIDND